MARPLLPYLLPDHGSLRSYTVHGELDPTDAV